MNSLLFIITITILTCFPAVLSAKNELKAGDKAPNFLLMDKNGIYHTLDEWRGKKIALYFYPKDNTPGCTEQACNLRDNFSELTDENIVIIGVSKGSLKNKNKFSEKHHLEFPLLVATNETLNAYGVEGGLLNFYLPKRHTFLINEDGIIVDIITKVNVKNHAQQIINGFKNS